MKLVEKGSWAVAVSCSCCNSKLEAQPRDLRVAGDGFSVSCRVCGTHLDVDAASVPPKIAEGARKRAEKPKKPGKR